MRGEMREADELLGTEEVARVLGVGQVTIWRWCREGSLPCAKIGRQWRVRRSALEEFVRRSVRSQTLTGQLRGFVEVPDNARRGGDRRAGGGERTRRRPRRNRRATCDREGSLRGPPGSHA